MYGDTTGLHGMTEATPSSWRHPITAVDSPRRPRVHFFGASPGFVVRDRPWIGSLRFDIEPDCSVYRGLLGDSRHRRTKSLELWNLVSYYLTLDSSW